MKDTVEIEQKFRVENHETYFDKLKSTVAFGMPTLEVDIYYQHPSKDYSQTDELLKVRNWREITYKGPKMDANCKVRSEYTWMPEYPELLLETLGFIKLLEIHKNRITGKFSLIKNNQAFSVTVALDKIANLGNFIEIEIVTDKTNISSAIQCIEELAQEIGLHNIETKNYFELLFKK
jgi:adenylate cyclase class 2